MLNNLKPLVIILVLAWVAFLVARPVCLRYMSLKTFTRRRNIWFTLTIAAFFSPSFWLYALFSIGLLLWAARKDENPLALYVLVTFVIPNVHFYLPTVLVSQLFDLTQYRILSLAVLLPAITRIAKNPGEWGSTRLRLPDVLMLAFLLLQLVLSIPYETPTNTLRRAFLLWLDTFVVFYAFSRITDRTKLHDVMTCFWVSCAIMVPIAVFEWGKGWLMYTDLAGSWGDPNDFAYLFRGGGLRAQAAAGHSINLSYVLSIALGFFLFVRGSLPKTLQWATFAAFGMAIIATGSRGGWLTAAFVLAVYSAFRPDAFRRLGGAAVIGTAVMGIMYVTPLKESVIDKLPIIGTSDQDTIEYRQQLFDVSIRLIKQNPFFGDPLVANNMEELRQGQGIIDIVNGYIFTALFTGLVGLSLLLLIFSVALWQCGRAFLLDRRSKGDDANLGAVLLAVFLASLFYIATAGYGTTTYMTVALLLSYATIVLEKHRTQVTRPGWTTHQTPSFSQPSKTAHSYHVITANKN